VNTCEEFLEAISLSADGLLEEPAQSELAAHLADCPACAARLEAFRALGAVMPSLSEAPPDTLVPGVLYKIDAEARRPMPSRRRLISLGAVAAVLAVVLILQGKQPWNLPADAPVPPADAAFGAMSAPESMDELPEATLFTPEAEGGDHLTAARDGASEYAGDANKAAVTAPTDLPPPASNADAAATAPPEPHDMSDFINTAIFSAPAVPEALASYAQTDFPDRVEIVIPYDVFVLLWPEFQDRGATLIGAGSDDVVSTTGQEDGDPQPTPNELAGPEGEQALVIIYLG
jgi:hypothetical protein